MLQLGLGRVATRSTLIRRFALWLVAAMAGLALMPTHAASPVFADSPPREITFWSALQGAQGLVSTSDLQANASDTFIWVTAGQSVRQVTALGPAWQPAPDGTASAYSQVNCVDAATGVLSQEYTSPSRELTVPGTGNSWENPPIPTLFISDDVPIPAPCVGSGSASPTSPDGWIYSCAVDPNFGNGCVSIPFGVLSPGQIPPGDPFPTGSGTLYTWVSPSQWSDIQTTGHFDPAQTTAGEYFYQSIQEAMNVQTLFESDDLVQASFESGSVFDLSVGITGVAAGSNALYVPEATMESLFGIAEVLPGG